MRESPLKQLARLGQSVWLDYIKRDLIVSGQLQRLIENDGLRGMTSNPSIFEKAIVDSNDYDPDIRSMLLGGMDAKAVYEALTQRDVQMAADEFKTIYERMDGSDGYVSLEVNPHLAHDAQGTIEEARRLWKALNRPNVLIKVPATLEGLAAITQLTREGINLNVTLLFGLPRYRQVANAYIAGLEARMERGESVAHSISVASFFLSRIDACVDPLLEKIIERGGPEADIAIRLLGQVAVASAKMAYRIYGGIFDNGRFAKLAEAGAHPQRVLWASVGNKNPKYSDVKYIDALIGMDTVTTIPVETLNAFRDHGNATAQLAEGIEDSVDVAKHLQELGISIDDIAQQLEDEGVEKFNQPFDKLMEKLAETSKSLKPAKKCILTINEGSSSIKFALFEIGSPLRRILEGDIKQIGYPDATLRVKGLNREDNFSRLVTAADHTVADYAAAVAILVEWINEYSGRNALAAVGHRVVHGGPKYSMPQQITAEMIVELYRLIPFDPEHMSDTILLIDAFHRSFPKLPQVACFDTAFHHDLPRVAQLLPIPRRYEAQGVRRYGFHGLSYEFLMGELGRLTGAKTAKGRIILAHLGNGASLAAVRNGKSIDTSMSFTPGAGLPMSTRSGDLDPGLAWYLARTETLGMKEYNEMVTEQSGLLGVSETSSDMRDLLAIEAQDLRAAEAVAMFCYQVKKWIGSFAAVLGGLDTLVFSGGIGENAPAVRTRICEGLGFLGLELDEKQNIANECVISSAASRVAVRVIRTNEELMIARSTCHALALDKETEK